MSMRVPATEADFLSLQGIPRSRIVFIRCSGIQVAQLGGFLSVFAIDLASS